MHSDFAFKGGICEDIRVLWTPLSLKGPRRRNGEFTEKFGDLRVPKECTIIFAAREEEVVIAIAPTYG